MREEVDQEIETTTSTSNVPPKRPTVRKFRPGDIVRVKKETFHGKQKGRLAEVLGITDLAWLRVKYDEKNIESLPEEFFELICVAKMRIS